MRERESSKDLDPDILYGFLTTFLPRFDRYPLQRPDGSYMAVQSPITFHLVAEHIHGVQTIGAYVLGQDNCARWLCLDADDEADWQGVLSLADELARENVPTYREPSRRGGHLWLFFPAPLLGIDARRFGKYLLNSHNLKTVELYPKQDELRTGPGSLVRLPFGVHRKSGRRYHFVAPTGEPLAPTIREQLAILAHPLAVPMSYIETTLANAPEAKPVFPTPLFVKREAITGETPSERIKNTISVVDFVRQYVDLDRNNRGYCPFHEDHHMSFGVNESRNFWHCFSGCGGGSVIDFWGRWRAVQGQSDDFTETITELIHLLGL